MAVEVLCDVLHETFAVGRDVVAQHLVVLQYAIESSAADAVVDGGEGVGGIGTYGLIVAGSRVEDA